MKLVIVRYNAGNTRSLMNALAREGFEAEVSADPEVLRKADKVLVPGVGEARSAMRSMQEAQLDEILPTLKQPLLGICLGQQILCEHSEENETDCLGVYPERVVRLRGERKIPHMGWNTISNLEGPLFQAIPENSFVYFVHSFCVELGTDTAAQCHYGIDFSAALQRDNFFAVQFHPEKSGAVGAQILKNFLTLV